MIYKESNWPCIRIKQYSGIERVNVEKILNKRNKWEDLYSKAF